MKLLGMAWEAVQRVDGTVFLTSGNPKTGSHIAFDVACDYDVAKFIVRALNVMKNTIEELKAIAEWVRRGEYDREDARDEIARAIENRVRTLSSVSEARSNLSLWQVKMRELDGGEVRPRTKYAVLKAETEQEAVLELKTKHFTPEWWDARLIVGIEDLGELWYMAKGD